MIKSKKYIEKNKKIKKRARQNFKIVYNSLRLLKI